MDNFTDFSTIAALVVIALVVAIIDFFKDNNNGKNSGMPNAS